MGPKLIIYKFQNTILSKTNASVININCAFDLQHFGFTASSSVGLWLWFTNVSFFHKVWDFSAQSDQILMLILQIKLNSLVIGGLSASQTIAFFTYAWKYICFLTVWSNRQRKKILIVDILDIVLCLYIFIFVKWELKCQKHFEMLLKVDFRVRLEDRKPKPSQPPSFYSINYK